MTACTVETSLFAIFLELYLNQETLSDAFMVAQMCQVFNALKTVLNQEGTQSMSKKLSFPPILWEDCELPCT